MLMEATLGAVERPKHPADHPARWGNPESLEGAADADHSGGYVIGAGDSRPCPARAGGGFVIAFP
jgi:hypothetical protein